jgi:hypothetical protein
MSGCSGTDKGKSLYIFCTVTVVVRRAIQQIENNVVMQTQTALIQSTANWGFEALTEFKHEILSHVRKQFMILDHLTRR